MKFFFSLLAALLFLFSCGSSSYVNENNNEDATKKIVQEQILATGTIVPKIICDGDSRFSYALYLPAQYKDTESWPVIIFFDAHASGVLPLEKYKKLADEFGFVLAGSNESKNGIAQGIYADIKIAVQNDLNQKVKIDNRRIYLGGFSGGARVAINLAIGDRSVAGVIANSAGFEPSRTQLRKEMCFVGLAGNEDFNWREQNKTESNLDAYPFAHCLIEFDGKHDWAPENSMRQAFLFLDCAAKKNSGKIKNADNIKIAFEEDSVRFTLLKKDAERFKQLKKIVKFYSGVMNISKYEKEFTEMAESPAIKKWITEKEGEETKEGIMQNDYYQKVFTEDLGWWDHEVKRMKSEKRGTEKYRLNKRLLSYVSLAVYMTINQSMAQRDDFAMEKFISVYEMVDPENPEWAYDRALLRAKQGNISEAKKNIKKAVELGFEDKERFMNQSEFLSLTSDPEIQNFFK